MLLYSSCLIWLFHSAPLVGQTITMYENNQEDNVTNCTFGLVSNVDTVVFKGKVDYSQDINIKLVYFQLRKKREPEYWFIEGIDVQEHCNGTAAKKISCVHIENHIIIVTIKIIAKKEYSVARIRGVIITSNNQQITSDAQNFPQITDPTDINGALFIDGIKIASTNNNYFVTTSGPDVSFKFECESKVSPCLIEISGTGLMNPVKGKIYVSHTFREQQLNITIKQALCTLDRQVVAINCIIKTNSNSTTDKGTNHKWFFALFGVIPITVCLYFIVLRNRSRHQLCSARQDKKQTRDIEQVDRGCQASLLEEKCILDEHEDPVNDSLLGKNISDKHVEPRNVSLLEENCISDQPVDLVNANTETGASNVTVEIKHFTHTNKDPLLEADIFEKHVEPLNANTLRREPMVTVEINKFINNIKGDFARIKQQTNEDFKDTRFSAERKEHNLFQNIFEAKKSDYFYEIKNLELIPRPDDVVPLPDQTGEIDFKIKNDIFLSVKMLTENETNENCKCRKCQVSRIRSTQLVKLILIQYDLDTYFPEGFSNEQVNNIRNINSKWILEN